MFIMKFEAKISLLRIYVREIIEKLFIAALTIIANTSETSKYLIVREESHEVRNGKLHLKCRRQRS